MTQARDILLTSIQVRLDDDSQVILVVHEVFLEKVDGGLGVLGTLHIDSNEIAEFPTYLQGGPSDARSTPSC